jgi:hypothetical protein
MKRALAWWMSAPFEERTAALLVLTIWTLGALAWVIDPAASHSSP